MRLFGFGGNKDRITFHGRNYDPSRDNRKGCYELVKDDSIEVLRGSKKEARGALEEMATEVGATDIFGFLFKERGSYRVIAKGRAYKFVPKPKQKTNPQSDSTPTQSSLNFF